MRSRKGSSGSFGAMDKPRAKGDFYPSPPDAIRLLLDPLGARELMGDDYFDPVYLPRLAGPGDLILDAGAGHGRLTRPLMEAGYRVRGIELHDWGHAPDLPIETGVDFLTLTAESAGNPVAIVMNPPFGSPSDRFISDKFIRHALSLLPDGGEVHALLRHSWMCAKCRRDLMPLLRRIVLCDRLKLPPGDRVFHDKGAGGMADYSWFTFVKGRRDDGGARLVSGEKSEPRRRRAKTKSARGRALSNHGSNQKEFTA